MERVSFCKGHYQINVPLSLPLPQSSSLAMAHLTVHIPDFLEAELESGDELYGIVFNP
jgi:hypothetical protein